MADLLSDAEVWIIDETSFSKAGKHYVGVARQYCGALGKIANCQVAITLHWSNVAASCPLVSRLFVPKEWFENPERAARAKIPSETVYRDKADSAMELLEQAMVWGVPRRAVVADSFYGNEFRFSQELRERGLCYAVQVEPSTVVWNGDPKVELPPPKREGILRKYPPLDSLSQQRSLLALAKDCRKATGGW